MLPIKTLKEQKASLQEQIAQQNSSIRSLKDLTQDLRQKCGSYSQQPGSEKTKDSGTRIINHFTKEELQYDTK